MEITFSMDLDILVEPDCEGGDAGGLTGGSEGLEGLRFLRGVEVGSFSTGSLGSSATFSSVIFSGSLSACLRCG